MTVRRRALIPALTLTVVLAFAAAAAAIITPATTYKTTVGMSEKFPAFHGKLHSSNYYCVADRKVKLYREARSGPDKLLGKDVSEDDGTWSIPIGDRLIGGSYYATVAAMAKSSTEATLTCKAGKSQVAVVD
jgi:hypothetical protein